MAFKTGGKPLAGYPQPFGEKISLTLDRTGPASYTQVTPGAPPTGGDKFNASDVGLGGFDWVDLGRDTTGQISATALLSLAGYANAVPYVIIYYTAQVSATLGGQGQTSGTQIAAATNLSTFSWRVKIDGV